MSPFVVLSLMLLVALALFAVVAIDDSARRRKR